MMVDSDKNRAGTSKPPVKALKTSPGSLGDSEGKGTVTAEDSDSVEESSV